MEHDVGYGRDRKRCQGAYVLVVVREAQSNIVLTFSDAYLPLQHHITTDTIHLVAEKASLQTLVDEYSCR